MARQIRAFCAKIDGSSATVIGPEAHHLRNVVRVTVSDVVELFDGAGRCASATVAKVGRDSVDVRIDSVTVDEQKGYRLTLACAIPKQAAQSCLVFHAAEVGVDRFLPVAFGRSAVSQVSVDRWQRWLIEVAKQSGRNDLPTVDEVVDFEKLLAMLPAFDAAVVGSTVSAGDRELPTAWRNLLLVVGPEGGFTEDEERRLIQAGAVPMRLGHYVMRLETAAAALSAAVLAMRRE